ncbi:hypothetical protein [Nonomuraea sp. NPDC048916]
MSSLSFTPSPHGAALGDSVKIAIAAALPPAARREPSGDGR